MSHRFRSVYAVTLILATFAGTLEAKIIRLRNEVIAPKSDRSPLKRTEQAGYESGLYIVQFKGAIGPAERSQLQALGVQLIHFVPEDAFLARLHNVPLNVVGKLPFVQWVGKYRPEHKVHKSLTASGGGNASEQIQVAALLVPRATDAEVAEMRGMFNSIIQESKLHSGTILRGKLTRQRLDVLAQSETVLWIEPARPMKMFDEVASKIVAGDGGAQTLLTQSLGYDGSGVIVAVADSGLNNGDATTMHPDLAGRTPQFFYYGSLTDAADEHSHGTHVAGIVAGNGATGETDDNGALYGLGVAPGASIIAQRIFDAVGNFESPPSFERLTRDATRAGAVIGSNSWGDDTQGRYDLSAMEFDELVRDADALTFGDQQYILEFSAGNAGPAPQTVGSPAVAKNVIATGASENDRTDFIIYGDGIDAMADFSSRGPCEDGRIKPDVVAPGTWISSLQSASASDQYAWSAISDNYQYQGGTSQAGPHASGAAAVFVQYYRATHTNTTPSPALVKAALINSTTDMLDDFGTGPTPNNDEGWGRLDLTLLMDPSLVFRFFDQSIMLTNGQVFEQHIVVLNPDQPLKVTLTYSDAPGIPATIPALVNDLDLEVVGPDGTLFRGNQFDAGESIPNPPGRDSINNVEGLYLSEPSPGEYIVRIRGHSIVQDVHGETDVPGQDFAMVISGPLTVPGESAISFNRSRYSAPSLIKLTVIDSDLAGQPSVSATARSTTEPAGETVQLFSAGSAGAFTGAIATVTGPAVADGKLQIANNDVIQATYFDVSAGATRTATATGDLQPPILSNVSITNRFGQVLITWTSDEPSSSVVRFGTNSSPSGLNLIASDSRLTSSHNIALSGLTVSNTYYAFVVSTDQAGNTATNNNNGALYSFVVQQTAPLLLVDEYQDAFFGVPPLSGYTDALNQAGMKYDLWDVGAQNGATPSISNLRPYRAIIWRVPELTGAWSAAEQGAISNYLHSGGALMVASMELFSRLEEVGATNFIRNVLQTQSYKVDGAGSTGAQEIIGSAADTTLSGLDIVMDYTVYENLWGGLLGPDLSDNLTPASGATTILRNDVGDGVGLRWPGIGQQAPGRLALLTFPLDAVPMDNGINDRVSLLRSILGFLAPGISGGGTIEMDSPAYTLPGLVGIEVADADLTYHGTLTVSVSSTTQTNSLQVTLTETPSAGVFTGSLSLLAATNPPVAGQLRAKSGDTITAKYFDASLGTFVTATATVDITPPTISGVSVEPDYQQAIVSWDTSELADALVQFGESPLLGRTAYSSDPDTVHEVTMFGLVPDKTYYYQVVSRDLAGNTVTDDNHGQLYILRTLRPLFAPWSDNLDTGATNWSTYSADGSQSEWTLGVPNNGRETSAHSPPDAWGSNLSGKSIDYTETYLISPAIYLTNGNVATLNFWHSYDFSDASDLTIEQGEVDVVYNNGSSSATLQQYGDLTTGWEKQQLDLSPYVGQVVYLVWYYVLFSFDTSPHPGWLVDDVSITVSNVIPGTLQISNNLWQATAIVSGPAFKRVKGLGAVMSNTPSGTYIVEYADVPYFNTPLNQTNTLAPGGTLLFQGTYTFSDVNSNGISDAWELHFFGNISTNRTRFTDSDGDGMTDYAEFIAGTDPLSPSPAFRLSARSISNSFIRLEWSSVAGQQYRVHSSTNVISWTPYTSWLTATGSVSQLDIPISPGNGRSLFRIENSSTNVASGLPPNLRTSIQKLPNGTFRLTWATAPGHGYQVLGSTNGLTWTPVSPWLRASSTLLNYNLSAPVVGAPNLFRVQVLP
jgi:hypothetical protein